MCAETELTYCVSQPNCGQLQTAKFALQLEVFVVGAPSRPNAPFDF